MPRSRTTDQLHTLDAQTARIEAQLARIKRQRRLEAQKILLHRYVEVGEVVQAVGLLTVDLDAGTFEVDLSALETILKAGMREHTRTTQQGDAG